MSRQVLLMLSLTLISTTSNASSAQKTSKGHSLEHPMLQMLVPAYFYPTGRGLRDWQSLLKAVKRIPIVAIVNPASGPGKAVDKNYQLLIQIAKNSKLQMIGYVSTRYGKRPLLEVKKEIDRWKRFYPQIDGIFLDEQSSKTADVAWYREVCKFARERFEDPLLISNPGTICAKEYFNKGGPDTICVFEQGKPLAALKTPDWMNTVPPHRLAGFAHSLPSGIEMSQQVKEAMKARIGCLYLTDDGLPNPWDKLPAKWDEIVSIIQRTNQTIDP